MTLKRHFLYILVVLTLYILIPAHQIFAQDFPKPYQLAEPLPGSTERGINSLSQYLTIAYVSMLSAAIAFALVMLVYSGVEYITAGGNQSAIGNAKSRMKRIGLGFLIIVGAVLLLTTLGGDSLTKIDFTIDRTSIPQSGGGPTSGTPGGSPSN